MQARDVGYLDLMDEHGSWMLFADGADGFKYKLYHRRDDMDAQNPWATVEPFTDDNGAEACRVTVGDNNPVTCHGDCSGEVASLLMLAFARGSKLKAERESRDDE